MGFLRRIFSPTPDDERWATTGAAHDPASAPEPVTTAADELAKFAALRDQGVLTEEEFAAKKAQLLALDPAVPVGGAVVLLDAGPKKINVIKVVREATGSASGRPRTWSTPPRQRWARGWTRARRRTSRAV